MNIFQWLFPCRFDNCKGTFGCKCGTFGKKKQRKKGEEGIGDVGRWIYEKGKMTPEEKEQYAGSFGMGKDLENVMRYLMGIGEAPEGYLSAEEQYKLGGPLAEEYYQKTRAGVEDPYAAYESQLQPSLELTQDYINRQAQRKGLIRSGMPIESMGRAGVELAIREAQDRMKFRGEELARGGELTAYSHDIQQRNLMNLGDLYGAQQGYGLAAMGRQAGQAQVAGQYLAQPYQEQMKFGYYNPYSFKAGWSKEGGLELGAGYKGYGQ